jgi:hypothetical protein
VKKGETKESGLVLIATLMAMLALSALLGALLIAAKYEIHSNNASAKSQKGFLAAEGGLNLRAEEIIDTLVDYNIPSGISPIAPDECSATNQGAGDFSCKNYELNQRGVTTFVKEAPENPFLRTIPITELYGGLTAHEHRYTVRSEAVDTQKRTEAILELNLMRRLAPLFQFVAFFDKDLEILPGAVMNLNGPVHSNGDLYLNSDGTLTINSQVSARGTTYRGRKNNTTSRGTVRLHDPATARLIRSTGARRRVTTSEAAPFNGRLESGVDELVVPSKEILRPEIGQVYWDKADLRLVLRVDTSGAPITSALSPTNPTGVWIYDADKTINTDQTHHLNNCIVSGGELEDSLPVGSSLSFFNNRENKLIRMMEIDLRRLFRCIETGRLLGSGKTLADSSEGGLVIHLSVDGRNATTGINNYGIRVRNAATLRSSTSTDPIPRGVTLVTNQGFYFYGHYNASNWIPAAVLSDTVNLLSRNWNDLELSPVPDCTTGNRCANNTSPGNRDVTPRTATAIGNRNASATDVYAALLSGTTTTGNAEGVTGQGGSYGGGFENYIRLHEYWTNVTLRYRGSFVSLNQPEHYNGNWATNGRYFRAPIRDWDYDLRFNDPANLPPLSPRFAYLKKELYVRDSEKEAEEEATKRDP